MFISQFYDGVFNIWGWSQWHDLYVWIGCDTNLTFTVPPCHAYYILIEINIFQMIWISCFSLGGFSDPEQQVWTTLQWALSIPPPIGLGFVIGFFHDLGFFHWDLSLSWGLSLGFVNIWDCSVNCVIFFSFVKFLVGLVK